MAKEFSIEQVQELERLESLEKQKEWSPDELTELEYLSEKFPADKSILQHAKDIFMGGVEALDAPARWARKSIHGEAEGGGPKTGEQIAKGMGISDEPLPPMITMPDQSDQPDILKIEETQPPTRAEAAGFGIEMAEDPLNLLFPAQKLLAKPLASSLKKGTAKATAKMLSRLTSPQAAVKEGMDFERMALQLSYEDLSKLSGNPAKLLRRLGGESSMEIIEEGGKVAVKRSPKGTGMIGDISDDINKIIDDFQGMDPIGTSEARENISVGVMNELEKSIGGKVSGEPFSEIQRMNIQDKVEAVFERIGMDQLEEGAEKFTLREMLDLRRNINKKLSSGDFITGQESLALDTKVMKAGSDVLNQKIKDKLRDIPYKVEGEIVDAENLYSVHNGRLTNLMKVREAIKSTPAKELQGKALGEMLFESAGHGLVGAGLGAASTAITGSGGMTALGGAAGAMYGAGKAAGRAAGKTYLPLAQRVKGATATALDNPLTRGASMGIPAGAAGAKIEDMAEREDMGREPQSMGSPEWVDQVDGLAEQLMLTPIPRSSDAILENKEFFLAKVAQQLPMAYDSVKYVVEKQPEKIKDILPVLIHGMPQFFENDKYERVDGIVPAPLRGIAEKDLWRRDDLSLEEKTELNHTLNSTGEFQLGEEEKKGMDLFEKTNADFFRGSNKVEDRLERSKRYHKGPTAERVKKFNEGMKGHLRNHPLKNSGSRDWRNLPYKSLGFDVKE